MERDDYITKREFNEFKDKVNGFIEKVDPIVEALNGATALGKLIRFLGYVVVSLGAIYAAFMWLVHPH